MYPCLLGAETSPLGLGMRLSRRLLTGDTSSSSFDAPDAPGAADWPTDLKHERRDRYDTKDSNKLHTLFPSFENGLEFLGTNVFKCGGGISRHRDGKEFEDALTALAENKRLELVNGFRR